MASKKRQRKVKSLDRFVLPAAVFSSWLLCYLLFGR